MITPRLTGCFCRVGAGLGINRDLSCFEAGQISTDAETGGYPSTVGRAEMTVRGRSDIIPLPRREKVGVSRLDKLPDSGIIN